MKWLKVIMTIVIVSMFTQVSQAEEKPPLSVGRIAGEILAGGVGGLVGSISGFAVGGLLGADPEDLESDLLLTGIIVGYPIGSAIGVGIVGNIGNETGSFLATLGGSIAGGILGLGLAYLDGDWSPFFFGPPIGATIGFNLTRRYDKSSTSSGDALINFSDGKMSLAVPTIFLCPRAHINLMKMRF